MGCVTSAMMAAESEMVVALNVPQTTNPFKKISDHIYELRPGTSPKVDLVYFHGFPLSEEDAITGQAFWRIWTKRARPDECWPVTMLPVYLEQKKDANRAGYDPRVLAVSYKSGFELPSNVGTAGTDDFLLSEDLTFELILSSVGVGQERPVILVGHDLGGILIKQLILYVVERAATEADTTRRYKLNKFLENLGSVFFYSTPHTGSDAIERVAKKIPQKTKNQMLRLMTVLGSEMSRVNQNFVAYRTNSKDSPIARFGTFGFSALRPTNKGYFKDEQVCVEGSTRSDVDTYYSVDADHYDVCRPEDTWSVNFQMLADNIVSVVDAFTDEELAASKNRSRYLKEINEVAAATELGETFRRWKELDKNSNGSDGQMHGSREASSSSCNWIDPMDRNPTQQDLSDDALSSTSVTQDVREILLSREFDPKRVVCRCKVFDDAVQIMFRHPEGMATLFGVGLPYSVVTLQQEDVVKIKQLPQQVWWDIFSTKSDCTLGGFNCSSAVSDSTPCNAGQHQALSPEDAGISLSWIASLRNYLISLCRKDGGKGKDTADPAVPSSLSSGSGQGNDAMYPAAPSFPDSDRGTTPHEDHRRSQGQVTTTERGMQNEPSSRHFTVKITLDKERCSFYNTTADSGILPRNDVPTELQRFWMEPIVTIKFQYCTDSKERGIKKMTTTLDVNFNNDSACRNNEDADKFGWYHDWLRLSFKSTGSAGVIRKRRKEGDEILSDQEIRSENREIGTEMSTAALVGRESDGQARLGNRLVGHLQGRKLKKNEDSVARKESKKSSTSQGLFCLARMSFSIQPVNMETELTYLASMYPALACYDVWNDPDRQTASQTRIMGTVPISIEGDWEINQEENAIGPYDFSCQRDLIELQRSRPIENKRRKSFRFTFSEPRQNHGEPITSTKLQQKLVCSFIINHSFSHVRRLQRPEFTGITWNSLSRVIDIISSI